MSASVPHNGILVTDEDIAAVVTCLRSGWLASGPQVRALERAFEDLYPARRAFAVSSGTAALTLALRSCGIVDAGAAVAIPTYGCSALLDAVLAAGCRPQLTDIDEDTLCLSPARLDAEPRPSAVIAVHTHGHPAAVDELRHRTDIIIEDCCQSLGGTDAAGRLLGTLGDAAAFSFYATKVIACGEGGMLLTPDARTADTARHYLAPANQDTYQRRFNLRLADPAAALALSQFRRLSAIASRRQLISSRYAAALPKGVSPPAGQFAGRLPYRYCLRTVDQAQQRCWIEHLRERGIQADPLIHPRHLLHNQLGLDRSAFPVAERAARTTVSVPLFPALTDRKIAHVCDALAYLPC